MTTRTERRALRKKLRHTNELRDHLRDIRQRSVVAFALAMATVYALIGLAHDQSSTFRYLVAVALGTLLFMACLATAGSYYFYRRFLAEHKGGIDA